MVDIVIRNGHVLDPYNNLDTVADVAISNGRIVGVGDYSSCESDRVVDAKTHFVVPGLIDFHAHVYPISGMGISVETACLSSGVTTVLDAGSAGWANYESYRGYIDACKVRIKTYVNVSPVGIPANSYQENVDPDYLKGAHRNALRKLFYRYGSEELLGLKLRMNTGVIRDMGSKPLVETMKLAEELQVPVVIHSADPAIPMGEILKHMRKGDILTHMYHRSGSSYLLDDSLRVIPEAIDARKRGVVFDVGHAQGHCNIAIAKAAIAQGFLPDVIGTDACEEGMYRDGLMFSMLFILSKLLNLGMSLPSIIRCCTANAAEHIGLSGKLGCLSPGAAADVAILELKDKEMLFRDRNSANCVVGKQLLRCSATIKDGQVVYRDIEFQ